MDIFLFEIVDGDSLGFGHLRLNLVVCQKGSEFRSCKVPYHAVYLAAFGISYVVVCRTFALECDCQLAVILHLLKLLKFLQSLCPFGPFCVCLMFQFADYSLRHNDFGIVEVSIFYQFADCAYYHGACIWYNAFHFNTHLPGSLVFPG